MPTNGNESNDDVDNGVKWLKADRKPGKIQVESSGSVCVWISKGGRVAPSLHRSQIKNDRAEENAKRPEDQVRTNKLDANANKRKL